MQEQDRAFESDMRLLKKKLEEVKIEEEESGEQKRG